MPFPKSEADLPHPKLTQQPPPASEADTVSPFPGTRFRINTTRFEVDYNEGLKVGYKWYDAEGKRPLFAFGYRLAYTSYAYSDLKVAQGKALTVSFNVKNTGAPGRRPHRFTSRYPRVQANPRSD